MEDGGKGPSSTGRESSREDLAPVTLGCLAGHRGREDGEEKPGRREIAQAECTPWVPYSQTCAYGGARWGFWLVSECHFTQGI